VAETSFHKILFILTWCNVKVVPFHSHFDVTSPFPIRNRDVCMIQDFLFRWEKKSMVLFRETGW